MSDPSVNLAEKPRRSFLQTVALASMAFSMGETGAQAADSALLDLKRELDAAHDDLETVVVRSTGDHSLEAEQAFDYARERCDTIVARIEKIPATTIQGLKVKLNALDGIYRERQGGPTIEDIADQPTVDMRLIIQILDTLRGL